MANKHHDDIAVERTTPQGTQEAGVESGHENRDMNVRATMSWFVALGILAIVAQLVVFGLFALFAAREKRKDDVPSPLFAEARQPRPPGPRLLPEPWEAYQQESSVEHKAMKEQGLMDPQTDMPRVPDGAAAQMAQPGQGVASKAPTQKPKTTWQAMRAMPHDSSGGRTMELSEK